MKRMATTTSYGYGHSHGYGGPEQEDRLSSLSDDLLIPILSQLDTKLAIQSSILSKRWVNLWTLLPVLNFTSQSDYSFIHKVLTGRNSSIMIERLNIRVTDCKTMARVFSEALARNVSDLRIDTSENLDKYRPVLGVEANDSLISLCLKGMLNFGGFPCFGGLVSLRLERVKITETEPFSCFPNLGKLWLVNCKMEGGLAGLEVVGSRLSSLSISSCLHLPLPYQGLTLSTPNLVMLELEGLIPVAFDAFDGLPCLQTVYVDACISHGLENLEVEQQMLDLMFMLWNLKNAEYVHLSPSTIELLSLSETMIAREHSPFENLKLLNLIPPPNKPAPQLDPCVSAYLLKASPRAVVKTLPR